MLDIGCSAKRMKKSMMKLPTLMAHKSIVTLVSAMDLKTGHLLVKLAEDSMGLLRHHIQNVDLVLYANEKKEIVLN